MCWIGILCGRRRSHMLEFKPSLRARVCSNHHWGARVGTRKDGMGTRDGQLLTLSPRLMDAPLPVVSPLPNADVRPRIAVPIPGMRWRTRIPDVSQRVQKNGSRTRIRITRKRIPIPRLPPIHRRVHALKTAPRRTIPWCHSHTRSFKKGQLEMRAQKVKSASRES